MPQSDGEDNRQPGKSDQTIHLIMPAPQTPTSLGRLSPAPGSSMNVPSTPGPVKLSPKSPRDDPDALCGTDNTINLNHSSSVIRILSHTRGNGSTVVHSPISDVHIAHFLPQSDITPSPQPAPEFKPKPQSESGSSRSTSESSQLLTPSPELKPTVVVNTSENDQGKGIGGGAEHGEGGGKKEWVDDPDIFHSNGHWQRQYEPGQLEALSHTELAPQLNNMKSKRVVTPLSIAQNKPGKGDPYCPLSPGRRAATMTETVSAKLEVNDACRQHHASSPSSSPPGGAKSIRGNSARLAAEVLDAVKKEEEKVLLPGTTSDECTEPPAESAASAGTARHASSVSSNESHSGRVEYPIPKIEDSPSPRSTPPLVFEKKRDHEPVIGPKVEYELSQDTPPTSPLLTPAHREGAHEETALLAPPVSEGTVPVWQADVGILKDEKPDGLKDVAGDSVLDVREASAADGVGGASKTHTMDRANLPLRQLTKSGLSAELTTEPPAMRESQDMRGQTLIEMLQMTASNQDTIHEPPTANPSIGKIKQPATNKSAIHKNTPKLKKVAKLPKTAQPSKAAKLSSSKKSASSSANFKLKGKAVLGKKDEVTLSRDGSKALVPQVHKSDSVPVRRLRDIQWAVNDEVEALPVGYDPWSEDEAGRRDKSRNRGGGGTSGGSEADETEDTGQSEEEDMSTPPLSSGTTASEGDDTEYIPTDEPYTRRPWRQREKTRSPSPTLVVKRIFAKPLISFARSADALAEKIKMERADESVCTGVGGLAGFKDETTIPLHRQLVRTTSSSSRQSSKSLGQTQSFPSTWTQAQTQTQASSQQRSNTSADLASTQTLKPSNRRTSAHASSSWTLAHVPRKDGERYAVAMLGKVLSKWVAEGAWGRRDQVLRVLGTKGSSWTSHLSPAQLFDKWQCVLEAEVDGLREAVSGKGRRRAGDVRMA